MRTLLLILAVVWWSGCGSGARSVPPVEGSGPRPARQQIASVTNFGDSITCGYFAAPADGAGNIYSTHGYAGILDAAIAEPARNLCRAGDQAADMARLWVYPDTVPMLNAQQLYTVMIGTNDANACGGSSACVANWSESLGASLTWLALPADDKLLGRSIANRDAAWIADPDFPTGVSASRTGASLRFSVHQAMTGRTLFLAYRVFDAAVANAGTATVRVDGLTVATLNATVSTGHALHTQNGTADTVFVQGVPLGVAGDHSVSLELTSADGAAFSLLWAGVSSGDYIARSGAPRVLIGGVPATTSAGLKATVAAYNVALDGIVSALRAEGMNIEIAPTASALSASTDFADFLHPNTEGHAKLAAAFASALRL